MELYNPHEMIKNIFVYMETQRGMYGILQTGVLSNNKLRDRMSKGGSYEVPHTPGLWKHYSLITRLNIVAYKFGIKYQGMDNSNHFIKSLQEKDQVAVGWIGGLC